VSTWWQRRTLRSRLAVWYASVGSLLLIAFGAIIYFHVARELAVPIGTNLRRDLEHVLTHVSVEPGGAIRWDGAPLVTAADPDHTAIWFELWDENGRLVYRHWPFDRSAVKRPPVAPVANRETISIYPISDEILLRVLSTPYLNPQLAPGWMIRVMRRHETKAEALEALLQIILVALPLMIAALVAGGYIITRRWLTPLDQMVADSGRITARNLGVRLRVSNPHDELGQLAATFNVTLERLESAFRDLDRFVGDAAHELRSPLTALRNVGEVGLYRTRTPEEYRDIIASMLEEEHRVQALILRLLELAGAESGGLLDHRRFVQLETIVAECVEQLTIIAEQREQRIELSAIPSPAFTDGAILQQALRNLIDNALKYSPDGSTVRVVITEEEDNYRIDVIDQGIGISPEHRGRLAERFFRAGRGGDKTRPGYGLGLSITRVYMRVLGGNLHYERVNGGGSRFSLTLPREPQGAPAPVSA